MTKLWAKLIKDDKITISYIYKNKENFDINHFPLYLMDICYNLDIELPIIIKKHLKDFYLFNITIFNQSDFLNQQIFDKLTIENG